MTAGATVPTPVTTSSGAWRPACWLGAPAPGGLALPAAQATAGQLYAPRGVWLDDDRLVVCDSGNHRVLIWHGVPDADHAAADVVLGQASFTAEGPAAAGRGPENGLHLPTGVIVAEGRLMVADAWHHRILVWNDVPHESDTPPDWCLGQPSLHDVDRNRGGCVAADSLYWPYGIAWIAGRLHVADTGNRRLLSWAGRPDSDTSADLVLGQPDFTTTAELPHRPQGAGRLRFPYGVAVVDDLLAVADSGNNRVMIHRAGEDAMEAPMRKQGYRAACIRNPPESSPGLRLGAFKKRRRLAAGKAASQEPAEAGQAERGTMPRLRVKTEAPMRKQGDRAACIRNPPESSPGLRLGACMKRGM